MANIVNTVPGSVQAMRSLWLTLVAVALLAGCTQEPVPETESATTTTTAAPGGAAAFLQLANRTLPALHFDVGEFNATRLLEGSFPTPNTCVIDFCPEQQASHDLTADVPANAPVDVTVTVESQTCIDAWLHIDDGVAPYDTYGSVTSDGSLATRLVRSTSTTVSLSLRNCSLLVSDLGATSVPYTAEVRTAVRSTVLPTYLPVALTLQPGDELQAMGEGLQSLVVVPPGQAPLHLLESFAYTVPSDGPAGRYIVAAKGAGDAMLHGTRGTMQALTVTFLASEPVAMPSGQPIDIDLAIPGVPVYGGVLLRSQRSLNGNAVMAFIGDYSVTFLQGGVELDRYTQSGCIPACNFTPIGYASDGMGLGYFPEGLRPGSLNVHVTNSASNAYEAYAYAGYLTV